MWLPFPCFYYSSTKNGGVACRLSKLRRIMGPEKAGVKFVIEGIARYEIKHGLGEETQVWKNNAKNWKSDA